MSTKPFALTLAIAAGLAGVAVAQDLNQNAEPAPAAGRAEAGAFLGVATRPVGGDLARHLRLEPGGGLVVEAVAEGSPAAAAGLEPGDVLLELDGQRLMNGPQLAALVGRDEPGRKTTLRAIVEGDEKQLDVTLAERPDGLARFDDGGELFVVPGELGRLLGDEFGGLGALDPDTRRDLATAMRRFEAMRREFEDGLGDMQNLQGLRPERFERLFRQIEPMLVPPGEGDLVDEFPAVPDVLGEPEAVGPAPMMTRIVRRSDGDMSATLRVSGETRRLKVEQGGETTFDGEVTTPEQRAALTPEQAEQLRALEQSAGLRRAS